MGHKSGLVVSEGFGPTLPSPKTAIQSFGLNVLTDVLTDLLCTSKYVPILLYITGTFFL